MKFVVPMAFSDPGHYCALARAADESGWDAAAVSDHVVHPQAIRSAYPYTKDGSLRWDETAPWPDPWLAIAAMAAVTERLRFFTFVYVLPLRNAFQVAKTVGTAAVLSGGRVALGLGVGWMQDEFELLGQDFRRRGRRADEMIEILRKLWTGEMVEHHGRFYDFEPLRMLPAPSERIPLYVGGVSEPALRRAARLGDGWVGSGHTPEQAGELLQELAKLREQAGRSADPFEAIVPLVVPPDFDTLRRLSELGASGTVNYPFVYTVGPGATLEQKLDMMKRVGDEVVAPLRDA